MASLVKCRIKLAYSQYVHIQKNTNIEGFLSCFLGTACFFVRARFKYLCLKDTGIIQSSGSWGNLSFLELSENTCFDPEAQFRFRNNGAMLNLKRQGCVAAFNRNGSGYNLDMFYLFVDSVSLDTNACAQKPNESIYRAITHTFYQELSVHYKGNNSSSFGIWRGKVFHSDALRDKYKIPYYIALSPSQRYHLFFFGKFL